MLSVYEERAWQRVVERKAHIEHRGLGRHVPTGVRDMAERFSKPARERMSRPSARASRVAEGFQRAAQGVQKFIAKSAALTLSRDRIFTAYRKSDVPVESMSDIRALDLSVVELVVMPRYFSHAYSLGAAVEGAGAGLVLTGGVVGVASGVGAAPGTGTIVASVSTDLATTLALTSRVIHHTGMYYGYDCDEPGEELFHLAIMNMSTALSRSAQMATYTELATVTRLLALGKPWAELNKHVIPVVAAQFMRAFGIKLTKSQLGKLVPGVAVFAGFGTNYFLLGRVAEAAQWAYRERFLLEKRGGDPPLAHFDGPDDADPDDVHIDLIALLREQGIFTDRELEAGSAQAHFEESSGEDEEQT